MRSRLIYVYAYLVLFIAYIICTTTTAALAEQPIIFSHGTTVAGNTRYLGSESGTEAERSISLPRDIEVGAIRSLATTAIASGSQVITLRESGANISNITGTLDSSNQYITDNDGGSPVVIESQHLFAVQAVGSGAAAPVVNTSIEVSGGQSTDALIVTQGDSLTIPTAGSYCGMGSSGSNAAPLNCTETDPAKAYIEATSTGTLSAFALEVGNAYTGAGGFTGEVCNLTTGNCADLSGTLAHSTVCTGSGAPLACCTGAGTSTCPTTQTKDTSCTTNCGVVDGDQLVVHIPAIGGTQTRRIRSVFTIDGSGQPVSGRVKFSAATQYSSPYVASSTKSTTLYSMPAGSWSKFRAYCNVSPTTPTTFTLMSGPSNNPAATVITCIVPTSGTPRCTDPDAVTNANGDRFTVEITSMGVSNLNSCGWTMEWNPSGVFTPTPTFTNTPTITDTPTITNTPMNTSTNTPGPSSTPTNTGTNTNTPTNTATPTITPTATNTPPARIYSYWGLSNMSGRVVVFTPRATSANLKLYGNDYNTWLSPLEPIDAIDDSFRCTGVTTPNACCTGAGIGTCVQVDTTSKEPPNTVGSGPMQASGMALLGEFGASVGIVPCPLGGTTLPDWLPASNHDNRSTLYGSCHHRFIAAVSALGGSQSGIFIDLGGNDAKTFNNASNWTTNMTTLINTMRSDFGNTIPICYTQTNDLDTGGDFVFLAEVQAAQNAFSMPHVKMIRTSNVGCTGAGMSQTGSDSCCTDVNAGTCTLTVGGDGVHYNQAAYDILGVKMKDCMILAADAPTATPTATRTNTSTNTPNAPTATPTPTETQLPSGAVVDLWPKAVTGGCTFSGTHGGLPTARCSGSSDGSVLFRSFTLTHIAPRFRVVPRIVPRSAAVSGANDHICGNWAATATYGSDPSTLAYNVGMDNVLDLGDIPCVVDHECKGFLTTPVAIYDQALDANCGSHCDETEVYVRFAYYGSGGTGCVNAYAGGIDLPSVKVDVLP